MAATTASAEGVAYKEQIRSAVAGAPELPPGPVRLELAFIVGPARNRLNLWPTIDALDPILGRTHPVRDWHPRDVRITELGMHVSIDPSAGCEVGGGVAAPWVTDPTHLQCIHKLGDVWSPHSNHLDHPVDRA